MNTKTDVSKYVVNVQGKDFITFPGLLQEAHALGLVSIKTELVTAATDLSNPVIQATVTLTTTNTLKEFTGYGDANASNVAPKVKGALLRMAETRAIARALRFACNIDMAALEELDAEENVINNNASVRAFNPPQTGSNTTSKTTPKTFTTKPNSSEKGIAPKSFNKTLTVSPVDANTKVEDQNSTSDDEVQF
jgi:hypothetical protein